MLSAMMALGAGIDQYAGLRRKKMANSGQSGTKVLKLAGTLLAKTEYGLDVWVNANPEETRKAIKSLCASVVNQAPNKMQKELKAKIAREKRAATKAEKAERGRAGTIARYDDTGFDPRDGSDGKPEKATD